MMDNVQYSQGVIRTGECLYWSQSETSDGVLLASTICGETWLAEGPISHYSRSRRRNTTEALSLYGMEDHTSDEQFENIN